MKRNQLYLIAVFFLFLAFSLIWGTHVRNEQKSTPVSSGKRIERRLFP